MDKNINTSFAQNVDALFNNLENFGKSDSVIGKPVTHEGKTFIPVTSVSVGYGSGTNPSKKQQSGTDTSIMGGGMQQGMDALGLGAKVTTEAILLIENNNVSVLPINSKTAGLVDKLPQIVSNLGMGGQQQNQNQQQG